MTRAKPAEVDVIVEVLTEAARWLLERGIVQWPDPFPRDRVARLVDSGEFWLGRVGGRVVATAALRWDDPVFWGERPPDAGYVHALAVRRSQAGCGLGAKVLEWAQERVEGVGRRYLRLDCLAANEELRRYYERLGFSCRGEVRVDDFTASLYERACAR
jgi:GNAT superfamily N-acetyltransferase